MKTNPDNALTPEERELAQLIGPAGPHGEPSPALDARILAAAHAAVASRPVRTPRPRWPVALGLAASVVFAVGIAWQLRPLQQAATVSDVPVARSGSEPTAPTGPEVEAAPAQTAEAAAEAVVAASPGALASAPATVLAPAAAPAFEPQTATAMPGRQPPNPTAQARRATPPPPARGAGYSAAAAAAPPPPPAPDVAAPAVAVAEAAAETAPTFVADAQSDAAARQESAPLQDATRNANTATAKQSSPRDRARTTAARELQAREADRLEVSGSRLQRTDLQVPVSEDAQLAVGDWLERVRTRYGLGDAGAARQSLLLFVKDHPGEPVPGDLEPLLDE